MTEQNASGRRADLLAGVVGFVDPLRAAEDGALSRWDHEQMR